MEKVRFGGYEGWRLTDGQTEAIVVPEVGRIMSYRRVDGPASFNWLWQAPAKQYKPDEWKNIGGDKTWPAPQSFWTGMTGNGWPPDPAWDGMPHKVGEKEGKMWMVSPVSRGMGARAVREFWFEADGSFVIEQAADKVTGPPIYISLWSVTQIVPPDAVFLPINPQSAYKNNFHWIARPKAEGLAQTLATPVSPRLLRVLPSAGNGDNNFKIGTDAPVSAAVAVRDGWAFVQKTPKPGGDYPDGAIGAGFPVEFWNNGSKDLFYNELELLSPLRLHKQGDRFRHTMRWSIHQLPTKDINSHEMHAAIEKIIGND
jgi:hypothetical protein